MQKLKRCPFCGGEADVLLSEGVAPNIPDIFWVQCKNCEVDTMAYTQREKAINEWNTRTPDWIPVEERLPEEKGVYLVTYHPCYWDDVESEIKVGIDTFMGKTAWSKRKFQRVIAWRPLPEPYRTELERRKNE